MSNLQNTNYGRSILQYALESLTGRRIGKRLRRQYYLAMLANTGLYDGDSSLSKLVGDMNTAHDQELIDCYEYAGRFGGTKESISDQEYYVDPVGGSDSDGNGTAASPFQTLSFLSYCLPARINHAYRIVISGDMTVDSINIDAVFGPNGSLSIIGAAIETVNAGAFTTTNMRTDHALLAAIVGGAGWANDQYVGNWIQFLDAPATNQCQAVFSNSDNDIFCSNQFDAGAFPVSGDDFNLISPTITVTVNSILLNAQNALDGLEADLRGAKIGFYNLNLDMRGCDRRYSISTQGQVNFSFVKVVTDDNTPVMRFDNSEINLLGSIDSAQILALSLCDVANLANTDSNQDENIAGLLIVNNDGITQTIEQVLCTHSEVKAICLRGRLVCEGDSYFKGAGAAQYHLRYGTVLAERCFVADIADEGSFEAYFAHAKLYYISVYGEIGVNNDSFYRSMEGINDAHIQHVDTTTIAYTWVIVANTMLHASIEDVVLGATVTADIQFNTLVVPTTFALPAVGVGVTDAIGSWVTGLT